MVVILIIFLVLLILFLTYRILKIIKLGNMSLITGGIKTGKSTLSVYLSFRLLYRQRFKYYVKTFLLKFLKFLRIPKFVKMPLPEYPLLYSNIPLKTKYVPVDEDLLLRKARFNYGSVVYMCESSLIADSMTFKNADTNEALLLFNKLFGHETKGGYLIYDTQSVSDNHYAVKRCLNTYINVHHTIKIPFFLLMWVRELKYSEDNNNVNVYNSDAENDLKLIIVPKRIWKKFDCYCYSVLTDDLPIKNSVRIPISLKAEEIVSFKEWYNLKHKKEKK